MFKEALLFIEKVIESIHRETIRRNTMNTSTSDSVQEKLPKEVLKKIQEKLIEKGATLPCPRCGNKQFVISDGLVAPLIQTNLDSISLGGRSLPMIPVICTKCGYISLHAIDRLKLVNELKVEVNRRCPTPKGGEY